MAKWVCRLDWLDSPHLTEKAKEEMRSSYSPHERDAREHGYPALGSGAIYPVSEEDVVCKPFEIPENWPRCAGLDVGWKKTACIWMAYDKKSDCMYFYSEYYRGYAEPAVHANAILARGRWMPILIDSHSNAHAQSGEASLLELYTDLGLNVIPANNGPKTLEPGILDVYQRLSSGRAKIFNHLSNTLDEFRSYCYDKHGKPDKNMADHLLDAMRFVIVQGLQVVERPPRYEDENPLPPNSSGDQSSVTGY